MLIGGLQKITLIDYPGKVAATIFTLGCSFRCPFCHNPELVLPKQFTKPIPEETVISFLASRVGRLDGVCLTGGEPTLQKNLPEFITQIKNLGLKVKLDTNGSQPKVLEKIIKSGSVDYFAMDIKGPLSNYATITASKGFEKEINESISLIMNSGLEYEFRTTVSKPLLSVRDFEYIGKMISGASSYWLQNYVKSKQIDSQITLEPFSDAELMEALNLVRPYVIQANVRSLVA